METLIVSKSIGLAYITIDTERCKGCRLCISFCPKKIIGMAPHSNKAGYIPAAVIPGKADECTGCAVCALMCPDAAISVYRRAAGMSTDQPHKQ